MQITVGMQSATDYSNLCHHQFFVAITRVKLITTADHGSKRLDEALAAWLPEALGRSVSKSKARKLIMAGAVRMNGKPVRIASKTLVRGDTIEAFIDPAKLFEDSTSRDKQFELTPAHLLFEDEDLIVVDKPPGLPAQPTADQTRDNLFAAVHRFLSKRDGIVKPYVGVHQRLDRDTSGAVLFTKSQRANAGMAESFSKHQVMKSYQTLTVSPHKRGLKRKLEKQWTIKNYLGKISLKSKPARYGSVDSDGALAETSFRLIAEYPRGLSIEAVPKTGRTHQIRVHLSEYGLPILGDDLYGAADGPESRLAPRLMLHAAQLMFPHPVTRREITVKSPLPEDFQECLSRIKRKGGRTP
jgi:RluA family pseudouridine synthase